MTIARPSSLGLLAAFLLCLAASRADAQRLRLQGIVRDEFSGGAVKGADVQLVGGKNEVIARVLTGNDGRFAMRIPRYGGYRLDVNGLGYVPFTTRIFFADTTQEVSAQVNLAPQAIKLEGLEVTTTATERKLRLAGFYRREAKHVGTFIGPAEIHEKVVDRLTDVFYGVPGIRVRQVSAVGGGQGWDITARGAETRSLTGGWCLPSVLVDGTVRRKGGPARSGMPAPGQTAGLDPSKEVGTWWQQIDPSDVAAIEVYPSGAGLPPQAAGQVSPCGAILIWTKDR